PSWRGGGAGTSRRRGRRSGWRRRGGRGARRRGQVREVIRESRELHGPRPLADLPRGLRGAAHPGDRVRARVPPPLCRSGAQRPGNVLVIVVAGGRKGQEGSRHRERRRERRSARVGCMIVESSKSPRELQGTPTGSAWPTRSGLFEPIAAPRRENPRRGGEKDGHLTEEARTPPD